MDPKVCGKLLTTHRRGYGVDVEVLRGRFPLRRSVGEGSKMVSRGYRRLWRWKLFFVGSLDVVGVRRYIGGRSTSVAAYGAQETGAHPVGVVVPSYLLEPLSASWLALQVLRITFVPKITLPKVSFRLESVWYSFSSKYWNRQKNSNTGWASG